MKLSPQLHVDADVNIVVNGQQVSVAADGTSVTVEIPNVRWALRQWRPIATLTGTLRMLTHCGPALQRIGLAVRISTPTRPLLSVGTVSESWFLKLIGIPHVRLHVLPLPLNAASDSP